MRLVVAVGAALFWTGVLAGAAHAQSTGSPLGATTPTPAPMSTPFAPPTPASVPSALGSTLPNGGTGPAYQFVIPPTALGEQLDKIEAMMFGVFTSIIDPSVAIGQKLFLSLAALYFAWIALRWLMPGGSLEELVANAYFQFTQIWLIFCVIGMTFRSPWGPGWFPGIINALVTFAQTAGGVSVVQTTDIGRYLPTLTFGTIVNAGFAVFAQMMTAVTNGMNGWSFFAGLTSGSTLMWFGVYLLTLVSGVFVVLAFCYAAFRYALVLLKAYVVACFAFLQGFLATPVTAGLGSGPFNAAINVGVEMASVVLVLGIFYPVISQFATTMWGVNAMPVVGTTGTPGTVVLVSMSGAIQVGAIIGLDVGVALLLYALKKAPDLAAAALHGRIQVDPLEAGSALMHGSSIVRVGQAATSAALGMGAGALASAAIGAGGASAGAGVGGRVMAAGRGALAGAALRGPSGALGGALYSLISGSSKGSGVVGSIRSAVSRFTGAPGASSADTTDATSAGQETASTEADSTGADATTSPHPGGAHANASERSGNGGADTPSSAAAQRARTGSRAASGATSAATDGAARSTRDAAAGTRVIQVGSDGVARPHAPTTATSTESEEPHTSRAGDGATSRGAHPPSGGARTMPGGFSSGEMQRLTAALEANTSALSGGARAGTSSSGLGGGILGGGGMATTPLGPVGQSAFSLFLYRQLLSRGPQTAAPPVSLESPAAAINLAHLG